METIERPWNLLYDEVTYNRVKLHYESDFALGVRILNAKCLSLNVNINPLDPQYNQILDEFILNLKSSDPIFKYWIEDLIKMMTEHFNQQIQFFSKSYELEQKIYEDGTHRLTQIDNDIHWLLMLNMCNKTAMERYKSYWESYSVRYTTQWEYHIRNLNMELIGSIKKVIELLYTILQNIDVQRERLIKSQKNEQKWSKYIRASYAEIQVWFDEIVGIIGDTCQVIQDIQSYGQTMFNAELEEIKDIFERIIKSTLVVELQPADVIKTEVNSPSTVRVLLTLSNIFIKIDDLKLVVTISMHDKLNESAGKIKMTRQIQFKEDGHDIFCELKQLKVEKLCRRRQQESVIEQKYILIYRLRIQFDNMKFYASVISWPVFVIVHHSQEPLAKAASMWDKRFPNIDRSKTKSVPWVDMGEALKWFFHSVTKCRLNDKQLEGLYEKAMKDKIIDGGNFVWAESCKAKSVPQLKYSFWEWFYSAMKLTRDSIYDLWKDGLIDGFVSTKVLNDLSKRPAGSFLLRFSESVLAGLIIMWVDKEKMEVVQAGPISSEMVKNRASDDPSYAVIVGIIRDLAECTHFSHNGISKEMAFEKFYKELRTKSASNKNSKYEIVIKTTFQATVREAENNSHSSVVGDKNTLISTQTKSLPSINTSEISDIAPPVFTPLSDGLKFKYNFGVEKMDVDPIGMDASNTNVIE
ncbi:signal transducer and transcription activator-like [Contarinia nasturtii]|uniref:signal transducer and transcription activator-like n=1 Tax=Contarinia nasturtii TaxID=265458 RepID=UPI0012D4416E|nr:signal transducer and transcription activator-like [Contarinia nasturtii]